MLGDQSGAGGNRCGLEPRWRPILRSSGGAGTTKPRRLTRSGGPASGHGFAGFSTESLWIRNPPIDRTERTHGAPPLDRPALQLAMAVRDRDDSVRTLALRRDPRPAGSALGLHDGDVGRYSELQPLGRGLGTTTGPVAIARKPAGSLRVGVRRPLAEKPRRLRGAGAPSRPMP